MADSFFCRECGESVIWGERVRSWVHTQVANDHKISLAKRDAWKEMDDTTYETPVFADRSDLMIGDPLPGIKNLGTSGSLDGKMDKPFSNKRWAYLRRLVDRAWASEEVGGKPCQIG